MVLGRFHIYEYALYRDLAPQRYLEALLRCYDRGSNVDCLDTDSNSRKDYAAESQFRGSPTMISARDAVEQKYKAVQEAFHRGDPEAISFMYTEDAEFFVPGLPIIEGRPAIREAWSSIVGSGGNSVRIEVREVQESGDLAYDTGRFTANAPDGTVLNTGKWIVIWKRQPAGDWKIHRDFMHWDMPPAQASKS